MVIEDCYTSVGDDGITIKSGWDEYGIAYGRPSTNILFFFLLAKQKFYYCEHSSSEVTPNEPEVHERDTHT